MKFLPYARLMRLPNVFTALADICLGISAAYLYSKLETLRFSDSSRWERDNLVQIPLILFASGCLYIAGMVWNDIFDIEVDRTERPFRPLPSGKISISTACWIGGSLVTCGILSAWIAQFQYVGDESGNEGGLLSSPIYIAIALAGAIFLYDGVLKKTGIGPFAMASCRFLNVLLGLSLVASEDMLSNSDRCRLAATVATYILGVTIFAKQEAENSKRWKLILGAAIMLAAVLHYPIHSALRNEFPIPLLTLTPLFLLGIGIPVVRAIRQPGPKNVQAAVKRCILGLIVFDAILATTFVGWNGLWIVLLLIPALVLGKWVYST